MKLVNYRLQSEMENLKPGKTEWFKDYVRKILESDKPYYVKADYIGLSIKELENKISYIAEDIKELQRLKKNLTTAKNTALEAAAEVLAEYGIDRLDGAAISSITITPPKTKLKDTLKILDEDSLIKLGYFKVVLDEDAVKEAMMTLESMNEIDEFVEVGVIEEKIPAKIKVNLKRGSSNNQTVELLEDKNSKAA